MTHRQLKSPMPCPESRHGALRGFALVLAMQILVLSASAQGPTRQRARPQQPDARRLDPGAPALREMAAGETHAYLFSLYAGQFARVVVEQQGVDVALSLLTEAGVVLTSVDDLESPNGLEELTFVPQTTGHFRLEVRAADDGKATGQYAIRLAE